MKSGYSGIGRRHHFVPEFIIKNFTTQSGFVAVYDKRRPTKGVLHLRPGDVFVESHLYSTVERDGSRDRRLEGWYSQLEGYAAPIVEKLIDQARANMAPSLTFDEREIWDFFVAQQWRRVPEMHDSVVTQEDFERSIDGLLDELEELLGRQLTEQEIGWAEDAKKRPAFRQNVIVRSLGHTTGVATSALAKRGLALAKPLQMKNSFILGSRGITRLTNTAGATLDQPAVEAWLPLAPDVAVTPFGLRSDPNPALQFGACRSTAVKFTELGR